MEQISIEDLIDTRILPFDLYSEDNEKIMDAGDILTPGKLLQLKHAGNIYKNENSATSEMTQEQKDAIQEVFVAKSEQEEIQIDVENNPELIDEALNNLTKQNENSENDDDEEIAEENEVVESYEIIENFDLNLTPKVIQTSPIDSVDVSRYMGPTNKTSVIEPIAQLKIKAYYSMILKKMNENVAISEILDMFRILQDKILMEINNHCESMRYNSEIKFIGEYERCHAINTAFLSGLLAKKMLNQEETVSDVIMAALLHDIGKRSIPKELFLKENPTKQEQQLLRNHTVIGYEIIKNEYKLSENIARVALQHHENYDGTGYPNGISGDLISIESRIVAACNYFDNLTFNKTIHKIRNSREALKIMLSTGANDFSPDVFFTFIYLFNYSDRTNFEDMLR